MIDFRLRRNGKDEGLLMVKLDTTTYPASIGGKLPFYTRAFETFDLDLLELYYGEERIGRLRITWAGANQGHVYFEGFLE